jgi:hypothetical protein
LRFYALRFHPLGSLTRRSFSDSSARNATPYRTEHSVTRRVTGHATEERAFDAALGLRWFNGRAGDQGGDHNCGDKDGSHVLSFWSRTGRSRETVAAELGAIPLFY